MGIRKAILLLIFWIAYLLLKVALYVICIAIGGALLALPGFLVGCLLFGNLKDFPGWYIAILMIIPAGIGIGIGSDFQHFIISETENYFDKLEERIKHIK